MSQQAANASLAAQLRDPSLLKTQALIHGEWVGSAEHVAVHDPASGRLLAEVPRLGAADAERAIESAASAWNAWRAQTARQRGHDIQHQRRLRRAEGGRP